MSDMSDMIGPLAGDRLDERRTQQREGPEDRIAGVLVAAGDAFQRKQGAELLAWAEAARQLTEGRSAEERRTMMIAARRVFNPTVLRIMIERALRRPEEQQRAASILRWIGPEGLEAMIDGVSESEAVAPRQFLHDALAAEPAAFPLILPLLTNSRPHVVRHGAELLGRLGDSRAVAPLAALVEHPAERVRAAAVRALAGFDDPAALKAIQSALAHASPDTRSEAARAAADFGRESLIGRLLLAFNREEESSVRRELSTAAVRLGAAGDMAEAALDRRSLLRWRGRTVEQRLDAVAGLAAASTPESRRLLDRLVREGDTPVRDAADRALSVRRAAGG